MSNSLYIYGFHAVLAVLQQPGRVLELFVQQGMAEKRVADIKELAEQQAVKIHSRAKQELSNLVNNEHHQGVVALCQQSVSYHEQELPEIIAQSVNAPLLLVLDGVQDPHNLGACLRVANAAGVAAVIVPKNRAVALTPTVRKVACGAAEITPLVIVSNLARCLRALKDQGVWLYGTSDQAEQDLYQCELSGPLAWVMGAEGTGLRRLTLEECDFRVAIPMHGSVSSLNVSVAAGVCLYETVRQRSENNGATV